MVFSLRIVKWWQWDLTHPWGYYSTPTSPQLPHPGSQDSEGFAHCIFSTLGTCGVNMDKSQAIYFQARNWFIFVSVLNGTLSRQCGLKAQSVDLSSDFKIIEHTEWGEREAHAAHARDKRRSQGLTEHGSCRRGTLVSFHPFSCSHRCYSGYCCCHTCRYTVFKVSPALKRITTWEKRVFLSLPSLNLWIQLVTDPSYISLEPRLVCTLTLYPEMF